MKIEVATIDDVPELMELHGKAAASVKEFYMLLVKFSMALDYGFKDQRIRRFSLRTCFKRK